MLLSEAVKDDHDSLVQAYIWAASTTSDYDPLPARDIFMVKVASCCIREELALLPVLQQTLPNSCEKIERCRLCHLSIQQRLRRLNKLSSDDVEFGSELAALWVDLSAHIRELDSNDLPLLEDVMSAGDSESFARRYRESGAYAPDFTNATTTVKMSTMLVEDFLGWNLHTRQESLLQNTSQYSAKPECQP
ncbi:hypothetical protein Purlil1_13835 [Purpureocillium lilacinum]|uniref:Uncharacterized protein n=1 Tax=Purpureocillium lilacinum TaxID=33203 RepID=A0ABR0BD00_PURLI|nr:hypothetical protein Purlil1_13835 [Purpureocillium lilacinum]